jgi:hypothetical protein
VNKSGIVICHLLMSPDRIIQAVNTIPRRDHHLFRLAFPNESFHFAVIPLELNLYNHLFISW